MMKTRKSKKKPPPQDGGLTPETIQRLRSAIRQVWVWTSYARRLCLKRALIKNGFSRCEECKKKVPKVYADHIRPVGNLDAGYFDRLFCPSYDLMAICKRCHGIKTRAERELLKLL